MYNLGGGLTSPHRSELGRVVAAPGDRLAGTTALIFFQAGCHCAPVSVLRTKELMQPRRLVPIENLRRSCFFGDPWVPIETDKRASPLKISSHEASWREPFSSRIGDSAAQDGTEGMGWNGDGRRQLPYLTWL